MITFVLTALPVRTTIITTMDMRKWSFQATMTMFASIAVLPTTTITITITRVNTRRWSFLGTMITFVSTAPLIGTTPMKAGRRSIPVKLTTSVTSDQCLSQVNKVDRT